MIYNKDDHESIKKFKDGVAKKVKLYKRMSDKIRDIEDQDMRLECLKLAGTFTKTDINELAERFYEFILGEYKSGDTKNEEANKGSN